MEFSAVVVASAMVYAFASTAKELLNGQVKKSLTFAVVFGIAVGVAFLVRASDFAAGVDVGGTTLAGLNGASTVLFAFGLASLSKVGYEAKKAVDGSDSAVEPPLLR